MTFMKTAATSILALGMTVGGAFAEGISTHVLDLGRGIGGSGVPVTLEQSQSDGWTQVASAITAENGRVDAFDVDAEEGIYRLTFDLQGYDGFEGGEPPFFPQIVVPFKIDDASAHYHVPIVLSPYGYSTYRGN